MLTRSITVLSFAFLVSACGGPAATAATPTGAEAGEHHHDESALPPPVRAFHDALAPLWHSDKGPDRVAKTCTQAASLRAKADATGDAELIAASTALVTECDNAARPNFETRFADVHERFHVLAGHSEHSTH